MVVILLIGLKNFKIFDSGFNPDFVLWKTIQA